MCHRLLCAGPVATVLVVVLASAPLGAREWNPDLAGRWRHDQGRSDRHYVGPEYPGRWMRVDVSEDRVEVEQALGGVKNGFPIAGSGEEVAVWSLPTDGTVHDVTTGAMTRSMSAVWSGDGTLEMRYSISLEEDGEMLGVERWSTLDDGASLEIERSLTFQGREKVRRIVFRREERAVATPDAGGP